ncbi:MAG: T9SS type A sorting domain-containing protein [Bacteroidia bacterium]
MKSIFFFLLSSITSFLSAQSIKTDRGVYPEPPPPSIPAAGGTFTDPVFGTTLLRITDSLDGPDNHQSYSYWPAFNKNASLLYISSVNGTPTLYDFDTVNQSISNKRNLFLSNPAGDGAPNGEDAIWSGIHTHTMLCHTGQKLYSYDVSSNTYTLIHDFSISYPNVYLWQMSRSINDSVFGFTYKENVNYTNVGYLDYRASNNHSDTSHLPALDEVQVDKSGDYLVIKTGNSGAGVIKVQILNLHTWVKDNLTDNGPDFAPGHSDNGSGAVLGYDNWNNRFTYRRLSSPHTFYSVIDYNNDWSLGDHASFLADDESWILFSTFKGDTLPCSGVFLDELYQASTDGSQQVRRLCHTHSDFLHQAPSNQYWGMPKACISRNGKFAVFTSNWGSKTRRDVFVLKIPPVIVTGVEQQELLSFTLYPNPVQDRLSITFSEKQPMLSGSLVIYNGLGQDIIRAALAPGSSQTLELSTSALPEGVYWLSICSSGFRSVKKFTIIR